MATKSFGGYGIQSTVPEDEKTDGGFDINQKDLVDRYECEYFVGNIATDSN